MDYEPGDLEAVSYTGEGEAVVRSSLHTTGRAEHLSCCLWRERDILSGLEWEEGSGKTGYLYQILITLKDGEDQKVVWDDREVKVQVLGAGRLAGIDSGNLADVTPFSCECRRTYGGNLVAYVQRTGQGSIHVSMELLSEINEEECRAKGSRYEIQISPIS